MSRGNGSEIAYKEPPRCEFVVPEVEGATGEVKLSGSRCVQNEGHEDGHVIAQPVRSATSFWQILDEVERTAQLIIHADQRDGSVLTDEECRTFWLYFQWQREHG